MIKCPICGVENERFEETDRHIIVTRSAEDGHIHVHHGGLTTDEDTKELIDITCEELKITTEKRESLPRKEFVFHNRQRIGDMLMFTCAVRDFKAKFPETRVNVLATAQHIWDHNPNIDRTLKATEENTIKIGPSKLTNSSNRIDWHFANAFRVAIEDALHVHIPQGESRPDIYLTKEEWDAPRITEKPYWIICITGEKGWGCKMFPHDRWQEFINQNPDSLFYQIGAKEDNPPRLIGQNVIDFVGQTQNGETGVRDLFKLFLNAEGSIGLVSFHMHLSGAFHKPAIVIAGAREPVHFTRYPGHQYLSTDGCLPCGITACWHCNIDTCTDLVVGKEKVPRCVDMIHAEDLTRALNQYYIGGRLKKGVASAKPKFKNIVPTPKKIEPVKIETYGMSFGGGSLTSLDWEFILDTIRHKNVKTVLELGAGLSTLLLNDAGVKVTTFETNEGWIKKIKDIKPDADVRLWDGKSDLGLLERYDLAFVDGPSGDKAREISTKIGASIADIVIVHDAGREWSRKYQEQYLAKEFKGPGKGGHRCHLWIKGPVLATFKGKDSTIAPKEASQDVPEEIDIESCGRDRLIKIVSTARGWGGCARSVTTIMEQFLDSGCEVEFIPFRNKIGSHEFQEWVKQHPEVIITENYDTLKERCDVLLVYADDYIWEFEKPEIVAAFSEIGAARKIMMLNYRRGKVGEIPWTKGWDKYMFLNSTQEKELLKVLPGVNTKVLPPCTDLTDFFKVSQNYNTNLRIVRHSSQGDTKFSKDFEKEIDSILAARPDATIQLMPGPSFVSQKDRFVKVPRGIGLDVVNFLTMGNLFWYSLPKGYMDMGPRVILEAMAAGLPILADNWGGAVDRVTPECGWLVNDKREFSEIVKTLTPEILLQKGQAARERAQKEFSPEKWIAEIINP